MNKKKVVTALLVGFLVTSSNLTVAQTVSVVADQIPNSAPVYFGHERNVARATDGALVVAWQDNINNGQVVFSVYDEASTSWSQPAAISAPADEADKIGLAADNQGRIHAAWQQRFDGDDPWQIWYSYFENGVWSFQIQVSQNDALISEECAIELDSEGNIFVVYNTDPEPDGNQWILCSISSDGGFSWSTPDTLSSPDGIIGGGATNSARVLLYRGSNGRMASAWHENHSRREEREIYINQYDGTNWMGEVVVSDTTAMVDYNWRANLVIDSQDNIHIIYATDQSGSIPRYLLYGIETVGCGSLACRARYHSGFNSRFFNKCHDD